MRGSRDKPDDALSRRLERATRRGSASRPGDLEDPELNALAEGWRVLGQALDLSAPRSAPPAFARRVLEETLRRSASRRRWKWGLGMLAAAVLLMGLGSFLFRSKESAQLAQPVVPPSQVVTTPAVTSPQDPLIPKYPAQSATEVAVEPDPWTELDGEIAEARQGLDELQSDWRVSPGYLEYISERFREMEEELAITSL